MSLAAKMLALALVGAGLVDDGDATTLPVSPNGGMSTLQPTREDAFAFADAGLIWAPKAEEVTVQALDAGAARPDAGPPPELHASAKCRPIAEKMAHRRAWLDAVEQKANEVGWEHAAQRLCELHAEDIECRRPPTAVEQDVSELVVDDPNAPPETDAWLVRWSRELRACEHETAPQRPRK